MGYPDWYKGSRDQKNNKVYANISAIGDKSLNSGENNGKSADNVEAGSQISRIIQQEVAKYLNNLNPNLANLVNLLESSDTTDSYVLTAFNRDNYESWIIDTRASSHITRNLKLFDSMHSLKTPCTVILPNGTHFSVTKAGNIHLQPNLLLTDVLYVSQFKFSFIFVSKLTKHNKIK